MTLDDQYEVMKADLAFLTGWSLEYIDTLTATQIGTLFAVKEGRAKVDQKLSRSKK